MPDVLNCYENKIIKNSKLPPEWQSQHDLDEFQEFLQRNWEQRSVFFDDGEITSRQQYIKFTERGGLRTNSYIGTVVFKGRQLNIFPKVFREERDDDDITALNLKHLMENLVQWLQYCTRINYPFLSITADLENNDNLRDLFITLYLHYVKKALAQSPFYRYEEKVEDLSVVKGSIDFKDYVGRKIPKGLENKFRCVYSEFEYDNIVNRIIKYTCKGLANDVTGENRKILRYILIRLNEVSDVRCLPSDCDEIKLSKLHRQYSMILSMSKMFLLNRTTAYTINNQESFCFLFPTELLFEGFIGGFISTLLQDRAKVTLQASDMFVFSDLYIDNVSQGELLKMRHDILVDDKEKGIYILDTKYKELSRFTDQDPDSLRSIINTETNQGDVYQMIAYAHRRGVKDVYLLYPMYRYEEDDNRIVYGTSPAATGITDVNVHFLRIPFIFEEDKDYTKKSLEKAILRIFD